MSDWIPDNDARFDVFYGNLINYVNGKCAGASPEWTHIPQTARTELQGGYAVWHPAYLACLQPHSALETEAKNQAKADAKRIIRPFTNIYLREGQRAVTNQDRTAMGVPNRDTNPTPTPVPDIKPDCEAVPAGRGKQRVTCINPQSGDKKRPPRVKGVAFACRVRPSEGQKSLPDDMPSVFQAATTRDFQYGEAQYGMVADYAVAYEAPDGSRGPWSDVTSVIIA